MKKSFLTAVMTLAATALFAQQTIKSENVNAFNVVSLSGNLRTELIPSDKNKVDIVLHEADIKKFKWGVSDGTLSVSLSSSQGGQASADVKIYYADPLKDVTVTGGELSVANGLKSTMLKLSVKGGAKMTGKLDILDLELNVTGNSAAQLEGKAKYLSVHATEKSKSDTREVKSLSAVVDAATTAEVFVYASERLEVNAKTGATVFYRGQPAILKDVSSKMSTGVMGSSVLHIGD